MEVKKMENFVSELLNSNFGYYNAVSKIKSSPLPSSLKQSQIEETKENWLNSVLAVIKKRNTDNCIGEQMVIGYLGNGTLGCLLELPETFNTEHLAFIQKDDEFQFYYRGIVQKEHMENEPYSWMSVSKNSSEADTISSLFCGAKEETLDLGSKLDEIFQSDESEIEPMGTSMTKTKPHKIEN